MKKLTLIIATSVLIEGCIFMSPDVISAGPDTYSVTSGASAGFSSAGVRAEVYNAANDFCAKHGLIMVPVSMDAQEGALGQHPPSATLVFMALKPGDPDIKRVNVEGPDSIHRIQNR